MLRTGGATTLLFYCALSSLFGFFARPVHSHETGGHIGLTNVRTADVPAGCKVKPENMELQDQSRMGVQLIFRKGRPFVAAGDAVLSLSSKFCSGSDCVRNPSATGTKEILLKRLNATLADIPHPDIIARAPLFQAVERQRPDEPGEDATEEEKAQYRHELEQYKRKAVEPPDEPSDDATDDEKRVYKDALKAFNKRKEVIDKLIEALHSQIAVLPATREARTYNGSWADFFKDDVKDGPFEKWRAAVLKSEEVRTAFHRLWQEVDGEQHEFVLETRKNTLLRFFTGQPIRVPVPGEDVQEQSLISELVKSPLVFRQPGTEPGVGSLDLGQLCFQFSDPINLGDGRGQKSNFSIAPPEAANVVITAMRRYGLEGVPWSQEAVVPAVNSYYRERGYNVSLLVSEVHEEPVPRTVQVLRQRVSNIRVSGVTDEEALLVLQTILPGSSFAELVRNDKDVRNAKYLTRIQTGETEQVVLTICAEKGKCEGTDPKPLDVPDGFRFIDAFKFERITAALADLHYAFAGVKAGSDDTVTSTVPLTITVVKNNDEEADAKKPLPTQTPAPTETPATPAPSTADATPSPSATPTPTPAPIQKRGPLDDFLTATLFKVCPRGNNLFYGGMSLRPRQGARAVGGYKCLKAGPGVAGFTAGEDGEAIGSLSYSAVVPLFSAGLLGARRLPLAISFEASTIFERSRVISGERFDERREGGVLRFALPLRPPAEKVQFDLSSEARRQTVSLLQGGRAVGKQNLTTLDFAARLRLDARSSVRPHYWELTPRLKLGLGLADGERSFALFSGTATAHGTLGYAFDYDLKGRISAASADTPVFERPSFGAPDTVRGFSTDDAIGLRMWSLQPELWLRGRGLLAPKVNPLTQEESRLRAAFRESLSFAVFYDVGGVYKTVNSPAGLRRGPGVGLRFNYNQRAYIKLDWAYGIGDRVGGRRLRFYFTLDLPDNPL